jgi:hypothetical protein
MKCLLEIDLTKLSTNKMFILSLITANIMFIIGVSLIVLIDYLVF